MDKRLKRALTVLLTAAACFVTAAKVKVNVQAVDKEGSGSFTVDAGEGLNGNEDLVIDFYRVADLNPDTKYDTFAFTLNGTYPSYTAGDYDITKYTADKDSGKTGLDSMDNDSWTELAQLFAKDILAESYTGSADLSGASGAKVTAKFGLYLIVPHDTNLTKAEYTKEETTGEGETAKTLLKTILNTDTDVYSFYPQLVVLPSTNKDTREDMKTSDGEWVEDLDVYLKPSSEPRFGSLKITKIVTVYEDSSPMTAAFKIVGTLDGKEVYNNVASITMSKAGVGEVVLNHIPAGAEVTVTETYSGAGYKLVSENDQTAVIKVPGKDKEIAGVSFTNAYNDETKKGYGVMNSFTNHKGDWEWKNDLPEGGTAQ